MICLKAHSILALALATVLPAAAAKPPSEENPSEITHPQLRAELLRMAHEDQVARSAG